MTKPIEQKLLALAEAATPDALCDWDPMERPHYVADRLHLRDRAALPESVTAFIAALDPATVSRLARSAGALRELLANLSLRGCCPAMNCDSEDPTGLDGLRDPEPHSEGCAYIAARDALVALDATPEGGK